MESRNIRESNEEQRACEYGYARFVNGYYEYIDTCEDDEDQEGVEVGETNNALLQYKEDTNDEDAARELVQSGGEREGSS